MNERRMIIFGCGYVGQALAYAASQQGYKVWIQSRNQEALSRVDCIPPERKIVSQLQSSSWHKALGGDWDLAINLVSSAGGGIQGYRESYIEGNLSIREWSGKVGLRRLIYTSATSVYPQSDGSWVHEEDVPSMELLSPSGQVLREAEIRVLENESVSSVIVLRLAGIYGPGRHLYLDKMRAGEESLPGLGSSWLNLIYLKDIVRLLLYLGAYDAPLGREVFNAVDNQPSRKQEIVDWLASELELPGIRFDPSAQSSRSSRRRSQGKLPDRRVSNSHLKETTGWAPRYDTFVQGYRDILA